MQDKLSNMVSQLSAQSSVPVDYRFNSQPDSDLAWMRIGSKDIHKAHRLQTLGLPDVYICDGPNDRRVFQTMKPDILLPYMRNLGGLTIVVKGSPDQETDDMKWVYKNADATLNNYGELGYLLSLIVSSI